MQTYDLVIPTAPKDYNKVKFCIASAIKYLNPQPDNIYVIAPHNNSIIYILDRVVEIVNEQEVLNLDPKACQNFNRPEWIYAQFIKMFQNISKYDDYFVVDSDVIFNRPFDVFSLEGKRQLFLGNDQYHKPYFDFSQTILGFGREYDHSFICDMMFFNKNISQEIAGICGGVKEFYDICIEKARQDFIPADYEIYGNYVYKYHTYIYDIKSINMKMNGRYGGWKENEILYLIEQMKHLDIDCFTYHTWI